MIYLTADEHYNHENIIRYVGRPFSSIEEMNETLIRNNNETVDDHDFVYHVGDFYFGNKRLKLNNLVSRLKGQHILIKGNHDRFGRNRYLDAGFLEVKKVMYIKNIKVQHKPIKHSKDWHLCGHVHKRFVIDNHSINIGVDRWEYKPISLEKILFSISLREKNLQNETS